MLLLPNENTFGASLAGLLPNKFVALGCVFVANPMPFPVSVTFELPNVGATFLAPNATGFAVSPLLPLNVNELVEPLLPVD